jgi:acyl carrier protein
MMLFDKIKAVIADKLSIDEEEIKMDSSFIDDLGADSLDIVELVMALEDEFDLEIPDEEAEKISTVADVVEYIKEHTEE